MKNRLLALAAIAEGVTGVALIVVPSPVGRLLLGAELSGVTGVVGRVAGMALVALAIACWPGPPRVGMLIYSGAVALYLAYAGLALGFAGILLAGGRPARDPHDTFGAAINHARADRLKSTPVK